jgi:predicted NAD/FAD-dependent oxidoreductase
MDIAIIGAGLAGLICAHQLQRQGNRVTLYEKCHEAGGRIRTRQTELGGFDHGAQYFTATTAQFIQEVARWRKAGWVAPWNGKLVTLKQGSISIPDELATSPKSEQRLVAIPGMGVLCQHLAQALEVRTAHHVKCIEPYRGQWLLGVQSEAIPIDASAGPFDAVIAAVPADEAIPLLEPVPAFASQAQRACLEPCWALMLGFQNSLALPFDGAWVQSSRLAWIAHDASKPQRRPGEHWVGHASHKWSREHLEDQPERVKEKLLKAFQEATGMHVQPIYASVHRWRHAHAAQPLTDACLWDRQLRIGACGDWFGSGLEGGGRLENAYLSGLALAAALR